MITLNDVLAADESQQEASMQDPRHSLTNRHRRTVYQSFFEEQERESARAEKSPVVVWAKRDLQTKADVAVSKLSKFKALQPREIA